jgi:hypothetical protein
MVVTEAEPDRLAPLALASAIGPPRGFGGAVRCCADTMERIQWQRRILIRWEYHAHNFLGFVQLACLVILFKQF